MIGRSALRVSIAAACLGAPLAAQQDFSNVEFDVMHVSGNVWVLNSGRGGNIGVSTGADGVLMVDDQFAPLADKIRAALREAGAGSEVNFLLNTHWHGDHTGGNVEFGDEATIIAHTNVRERLSTPQDRGSGNVVQPSPDVALPVITFDESLSIHFNGEEVRAFHVPNGHTDGDAVIFFTGSNVVHMGDLFFAARFPFVDLAGGGSVEGLREGIATGLSELPPDVQVIPGHGPLSTMDDLREYGRMLDETIELVRGQMDAGDSLEEIVARGPGDEWASWGEGFISADRWLQTIYQSLSGDDDADYGPVDPDHGAGAPHSHPHGHTHEKGDRGHP
ncbi:MAG: MBL fold metallo-hydrolase [Gemmatimonadetes bacterium]|nr:MBL fold metallo-hydrolase [Gemmatimonadota bacterium]